MKTLTVLAAAAMLFASSWASNPPATPATTPSCGSPAKICPIDHKQAQTPLRQVAGADSCTSCFKQPNGCCEAVCSRDSDGACYILQCCPGQKECTRLSCK